MSEYTKEQEAEALAKLERYIDVRSPGRWVEDIRIVLAMAKRAVEAEARAETMARALREIATSQDGGAVRASARCLATLAREALEVKP